MSEWFQWFIGIAAFGAMARCCVITDETLAALVALGCAIYCAVQCIRAVIRDKGE